MNVGKGWDGYMNVGKGMVVCDVVDAIPPFIDWSVDAVTFNQAFVPQGQVVSYLQAMEVKKYVVSALYKAIATYDPTQAIVILIVGNSTVDINLLQNLGIPPAECYKQVQQRRVEFQPALTTVPRRDL